MSEGRIAQKGYFDVERRLVAISAKGDPLEAIKKIVPWEDTIDPQVQDCGAAVAPQSL
jgi:hypothetical protein